MGHLVGIDLGTTNSVIAFTELGRQRCVKVDKNEFSSAIFPSVIAVDRKGRTVFGGRALREYGQYVQEFKRGIGSEQAWQLGDETCSAIELSAMLLREMRTRFEDSEGNIDGAVITVPANFTDQKRHETREAGRLAGLNVLRIINEPSAAAIAYTLSDSPPGENAVVIDWGGGTLDVSLIDAASGILDIKANDGDEHCGGMDIDRAIYDRILLTCRDDIGDGVTDPALQSELLQYAQRIKHHLSDEEEWDEALVTRSRPLFLDFQLTRGELEALLEPLIERVMAAVNRCLEKAPEGCLSPKDVTDVLLVGGSSRIPILRRKVQRHFGKQGRMSHNPMEVVAIGAAYQAQHATTSGDLVTLHSMVHSLGVSCVGQDRHGVVRDNMYSRILPASTKLPAQNTEVFHTIHDNQDAITVHVYEALTEAETIDDMEEWDSRTFEIPLAPAGSYPIRVGFTYDLEQILTVEIEIESHGYREVWTPTALQVMEARRPESQAKVEALANPGLPVLIEFRDHVLSAFNGNEPSARVKYLLDELTDAIDRSDLDAAREAKRKLGAALFDEDIRLP